MVRSLGCRGRSRLLRSSRPTGFVLGWVVALAVAAGCGAVAGSSQQPASHSATVPAAPVPAAATSDVSGTTDLAAGLLPADAFGSGAQVMHLPADRMKQAAGMAQAMAGGLAGVRVEPPACQAVLRQAVADLASVRDVAGELVRDGGTYTAELLVSTSPRVDGVAQLTSALRDCASVRAGAAWYGSATVTATPRVVPALGDGAAAVAVTATADGSGHGPFTGKGLLGVVQDGDRVLLLVQAAPAGAPDDDALAALLRTAYATESAALD